MQKQSELWLEWKRLCEELHINETQTKIGFAQLATRYGEPHRKYHTLAHIRDCLEQFESLRHLCEHPLAVELAIWFHDIVYNTIRHDNEEKSAKLMVDFAMNANVDPELIKVAYVCVLATKHDVDPSTQDEKVMIDVDLSILGRDWSAYEQYSRQIREEYKRFAQILYALNRRRIMQAFVDARPYIYHTPFMREHCEKQARANIVRELRTMRLA